MDCKEVSLLRLSLRLLRPCPVISSQLGTSYHKYKNHLRIKVEIDGLQGSELIKFLSERFQTFKCDSGTAVSKSTNS